MTMIENSWLLRLLNLTAVNFEQFSRKTKFFSLYWHFTSKIPRRENFEIYPLAVKHLPGKFLESKTPDITEGWDNLVLLSLEI